MVYLNGPSSKVKAIVFGSVQLLIISAEPIDTKYYNNKYK